MLALSEDENQSDALLEELEALSGWIADDSELRDFMATPLVAADVRTRVLESHLRGKASDLLVNTLQVLNRNSRLGIVGAVAEAFRNELDTLRGRVDVDVRTAVALGDEERDQLGRAVKSITGRTPALKETVDPALIGGVILQIEDERIDASVATELRRIGQQLKARASKEIHEGKSYWA